MSGQFTDINFCSVCEKKISDKARVVVTQVTGGRYDGLNNTVDYDTYDMSLEITHERCYKESEGSKQECESTSEPG